MTTQNAGERIKKQINGERFHSWGSENSVLLQIWILPETDLQVYRNPNHTQVFCWNWKADSKIYEPMQRTQRSQTASGENKLGDEHWGASGLRQSSGKTAA